MTPWTPVSCRQQVTSLRCWMFPFANTGMFTACLRQNKQAPNVPTLTEMQCAMNTLMWVEWLRHTIRDLEGQTQRGGSPYCLNVLPASDTRHGPFLLFGSAVYCQKLKEDQQKKVKNCKKIFIYWTVHILSIVKKKNTFIHTWHPAFSNIWA